MIWLWSAGVGVFSHETALALHQLSDILPSTVHMTVPDAWKTRRLRVPAGVVLDYGEIAADEAAWFVPVRVTSPARTILDCAQAIIAPDFIRHAIDEAKHRGLIDDGMVEAAIAWLRTFESGEQPGGR